MGNFFRSATANMSSLTLNEQRSPTSAQPDLGDEVLKDYDNLFRTMYQYPPLLDAANIATAYTECKALLHVVGQWPLAAPQLRAGQIDAIVLDLIEDKVDELAELQERVEAKLWRLTLTTNRGERCTPSNDYL